MSGVRLARLASALLLLAGLSVGCGTLYRHQVVNEEFSLYGNHDATQLKKAGEFIQDVIRAYRLEFPERSAQVPPPRIIYDEDELSRDRIYTSETRQEGYYLPFFRLIHLSPQHDHDNDDNQRTVILHEIAHHFLVSAFPRTRGLYWLNEGVACALEASFFDDSGRLVVPLYHLTLHQHARQSLLELGQERFSREVMELVDGSWFRFHQHGDKTRHYAMAWALVYHLLAERDGTLEQRVDEILALSRDQLEAKVGELPGWLRRESDTILERAARHATLRVWALRRWLEIANPDGEKLLQHLCPLLAMSGRPDVRIEALGVLTRALNLRMRGLRSSRLRSLRGTLVEVLRSGSTPERLVVLRNLRSTGKHPVYLRNLVRLLEDRTPEVRAEAAAALARLTPKPTITRPEFWRTAAEKRRRREIDEWSVWLMREGL